MPHSLVFAAAFCALLAAPAQAAYLEKLLDWDLPGAAAILDVKRLFMIPRGSHGITLVTVANPLKPQPLVVGTVKDARDVHHLAYDPGCCVLIANGAGGLLLYEVAEPSEPTHVGTLLMKRGDSARYVVKCGNKVLVFCSGDNGPAIVVAKLRSMEDPVFVGRRALKGEVVSAVQVDDKYVFAVTSSKFLLVIDGAAAESFQFKSIVPMEKAATSITSFKEFIYVAVGTELLVYATLNIEKLELAARVSLGAAVRDVKWFGGHVYCATEAGLSIVDVRDPRRPTEAGYLSLLPLKKLEVQEFVVYALSDEGTLLGIDCRVQEPVVTPMPTVPFKSMDEGAFVDDSVVTSVTALPDLHFDQARFKKGSMAGWRDMTGSRISHAPKWLIGSKSFLPTSLIKIGFQIKFVCGELVCDFLVYLEHCSPCTSATNGGLPSMLLATGWGASLCGPKFRLSSGGVSHSTVLFRKQVRHGESLIIPYLTKNLLFMGTAVHASDAMCIDFTTEETCLGEELCAWRSEAEACVPSMPCKKTLNTTKCLTCASKEVSVKSQVDRV
eukprot:Rhum_TRINITY_DN18619_c0_g1::Rhum_TRINITY_DN18619_c0_g1_i1::g.167880::m.167880